MSLKPRMDEARELVSVLDPDSEYEPEDMEKHSLAVLAKAFELYEAREDHGVLFEQDGIYLVVRGFSTANQAETWARKQGLKPGQAALAVVKTAEHV